MPANVVQVFEHSCLEVDEEKFTTKHFNRLVLYNEKHGNTYFNVGHKRLHFKSYVGVIQVDGLTIEVLPKADVGNDTIKWQKALFLLLRETGYLSVSSLSNAMLRLRSSSLLELFLWQFLEGVDQLVHQGLVKRYRQNQDNQNALKGRLLFKEQIKRNLVHKERFFTEHQIYDRNHVLHQIIKKALVILSGVNAAHVRSNALRLLYTFGDYTDIEVTDATFSKIRFNRKTQPYEQVIQLSRLIILNYSPDLSSGGENILSILFDMNQLFEKYVYRQLKKDEPLFDVNKLTVSGQASKEFWRSKTIRPDIVIQFKKDCEGIECDKKVIVDTKWKVLSDHTPSDNDLKQMYAYNIHFGANHSTLLYPQVHGIHKLHESYHPSDFYSDSHSCSLDFVDLVEHDGSLVKGIGRKVIESVAGLTPLVV
ncbi:restriction endonuclease [Pontibacter sp. KCTC 32443]|uniref:McrC family protein n=1 Tax=Pontibacter TaxID=323449 RepID=UPI00164D4780|nr:MULTISPECIES: restriction endonuclease [Pontibacter]MBC5772781.1 restriction endonuclease [Pontibacter sp. KCTC 32443]